MEVDPQSAAGSLEHQGTTYYFCSLGCLEDFKEDPEQYLAS
jgi:Cu+-exporting ATPase